jgi:hypothetical protein
MPRYRELPESVNIADAPWAGTYSCGSRDDSAQYTYYGGQDPTAATVAVTGRFGQVPVPGMHITVNNSGQNNNYDGNCHMSVHVSGTVNFHLYLNPDGSFVPDFGNMATTERNLANAVWATYQGTMQTILTSAQGQFNGGVAPVIPSAGPGGPSNAPSGPGLDLTDEEQWPTLGPRRTAPTTVQQPPPQTTVQQQPPPQTPTPSVPPVVIHPPVATPTPLPTPVPQAPVISSPGEPPVGEVRLYIDEQSDEEWRFAGSDGGDYGIEPNDLEQATAAVAAMPGAPYVWVLLRGTWYALPAGTFTRYN